MLCATFLWLTSSLISNTDATLAFWRTVKQINLPLFGNIVDWLNLSLLQRMAHHIFKFLLLSRRLVLRGNIPAVSLKSISIPLQCLFEFLFFCEVREYLTLFKRQLKGQVNWSWLKRSSCYPRLTPEPISCPPLAPQPLLWRGRALGRLGWSSLPKHSWVLTLLTACKIILLFFCFVFFGGGGVWMWLS